MTKIGIVSFPRYFNFGTYLQLYALQSTVSKLGYLPELIDYDPYNDSGAKRPDGGGVREIVKSLLMKPLRMLKALGDPVFSGADRQFQEERDALFQRFLETELKLGPKTYFSDGELMQGPPDCDAFIVGSDQVWHPIGHFKDSGYYLAFTEPRKRIAYAPSIGVSEIPEAARDWMREQILGIPHLSVREQNGASLIKELTGRDARVVLDPAYLLSAKEWTRFAAWHQTPRRPYVFCYILESDQYIRDRAVEIADKHDLDLFILPVHTSDFERDDDRFKKLRGVGPREFVGLIKDAAFVCTDSFHGTAFSIIFNRPFFTFRRYDNPSQAALHSRLDSILRITGLQHRVMDKTKDIGKYPFSVDFSHANRRVERLRKASLAFLSDAVHCATHWSRS